MKIFSIALFLSVLVFGCGRGHRVGYESLPPAYQELMRAAAAAEDSGDLVPAKVCEALALKGLLASEVYCAEDDE